ncbi:MAG: DUF3857 domain-containing protein [Planctomycetota bacterium]
MALLAGRAAGGSLLSIEIRGKRTGSCARGVLRAFGTLMAALAVASAGGSATASAADGPDDLERKAHALELGGRFAEAQAAFADALVAATAEAARASGEAGGDAAALRRALFLWAWCEVLAENAWQLTWWTSKPGDLARPFVAAWSSVQAPPARRSAAPPPELALARNDLAAWLTYRLLDIHRRSGAPEHVEAKARRLGFITEWQVVGPFENEKGGGFRVAYPPESGIDFEGVYPGKKHPVRWRPVPVRPPDGIIDLDAMFRPNEECIAYAVTYVHSEERRPCELRVATDDGFELWLNGRKLASHEVERACFFDQDVLPAELQSGWNRILIKVADARIAWEFRLRITDPSGAALEPGKDFEVSSSPARECPAAGGGPVRPREWGGVGYFRLRLAGAFPCRDGAFIEKDVRREGLADELTRALGRRLGRDELASREALERLLKAKTAGEWAAACPDVARVIETEELARLWYGLGRLYAGRNSHGVKRHPDREALARAVRLASADPVYVNALARVSTDWVTMEAERNENPRVRLLREVVALRPDAAGALYELSSHALRRQGNAGAALELARRAVAIAKDLPLAEVTELDCYSSLEWRELARAGLEKLARKYPGDTAVQGRWGAELFRSGRAGEAYRAYARAHAADADVEHYREGVEACLHALGKTYAAIELRKRAVAADPFDVASRVELARLYAAKEDFASSAAAAREALDVCPNEHLALEALGKALQALGKPAEALEAWRRALEIAPNFVRLERYLEFLEGKPTYDRAFAEDTAPLIERARAYVPEEGDPLVEVLEKTIDRVNLDGTTSRTVHRIVQVRNSRGIEELGTPHVFFYPGEQIVKVRTARVHRADGSVEDAPTAGPGGALRTGYAGRSAVPLRLPPLRAGDIVELEYRVDDTEQGFFGKYFGNIFLFQGARPRLRSKYILIAPKELALFFNTRGRKLEPVVTDWPEAGAVVRTWTVEPAAKVRTEPGMPPLEELALQVQVSTYMDWGEFGRWYWNLVKDQHRTDADLEAKTRELVAGAATDTEKIRAIYDFVSSDVQYSAWEFGVHGFKPYRATKIFAQRFGDCKDKATLIKTMLGLVGIESRPALVRAAMRTPAEDLSLPLFGHFNHMIVYVPPAEGRGALWLDGTMALHGMETVPVSDAGKLACVVYPDGGKLVRIPQGRPEENALAEEAEIEISRAGAELAARVSVSSRATGWLATFARFRMNGREAAKSIAGRLYGRQMPGLRIFSMETSDLEDTGVPVMWKFKGVAGEFGAARDAGGVGRAADARWFFRTLGSPFRGIFRGEWRLLAPERLSDYATLASREHDLVLAVPWRYESEAVFKLAEGVGGEGLEFAGIPRDVALERPFGRVRIAYIREGRTLRVSKLVEISTDRVGPADYEEFRTFLNRADRAERQEMGVRVAE